MSVIGIIGDKPDLRLLRIGKDGDIEGLVDGARFISLPTAIFVDVNGILKILVGAGHHGKMSLSIKHDERRVVDSFHKERFDDAAGRKAVEALDAQDGGLVFEDQVDAGCRYGRIRRQDGRDGGAGRRDLVGKADKDGAARAHGSHVFSVPVAGVYHMDGPRFGKLSFGNIQRGDAGLSVDGGYFQDQRRSIVVKADQDVPHLPFLVELMGF